MTSRIAMRMITSCLLVTGLVSACGEPTAIQPLDSGAGSLLASPALIQCPANTTESATAIIGPEGGTVSVAGSSITLPLGAVPTDTEIRLTVPASRYMEIEITANGLPTYEFLSPATVVIGYSRCSRSNFDKKELTAWYIDSVTKALIEQMLGSSDDKTARTVTFLTPHLSSYAIAE